MCWIDWVMSCVPLADFNIDNTGEFLGAIRDSLAGAYKSAGGFTEEQCGAWLKSQPRLKEICDIAYEILDNRSSTS